MDLFDIEVVRGGEIIAAERSVALENSKAAWPKVAEVARNFSKSGAQIRVMNKAREITILIGVNSMQRYCHNWR